MKKQFLDLGRQPIANGFLYENDINDEFFFNLKVGFDADTYLVSLCISFFYVPNHERSL